MPTFEIIDPHIHLWNPWTTPRTVSPIVKLFGGWPWLAEQLLKTLSPKSVIEFVGDGEHYMRPYLPATYFSETGKYKVKGFVHVQADWQAKKPLDYADETKWLAGLENGPLAIIGEARLDDLLNLEKVLDAHLAASSRFKGVRDMLAAHPSKKVMRFSDSLDRMKTDDFRKGYAVVGSRNLSYDAFLYSNQLQDFCDLVEAIPDTPVVLDHFASPVGLMGPFCGVGQTENERTKIKEEWYEGMTRLANSPHVMIKLSGLLMPIVGWNFKVPNWPPSIAKMVDMIGPHIRFAIDTFGIDRCMFASNFPPDRVLVPFEYYYDVYFKVVEDLTESEKKKLFHDNAIRFYRLNETGT